jgi:hypothetical protein
MLLINHADIYPIDTFPLLWRWNQASHAVLSNEEITSIEPLIESKSKELLDIITRLKRNNFQGKPYSINAEGSDEGVSRLLNNLALENGLVLVSWHEQTAVRMPLPLFIHRWSDFCYPSSDDVSILPVSEGWLLEYWHYEIFTWSKFNAT